MPCIKGHAVVAVDPIGYRFWYRSIKTASTSSQQQQSTTSPPPPPFFLLVSALLLCAWTFN